MQDELIVFGHNDLDQIGSMLSIEYKMPNIQKKYFYTNYGDIEKQVQAIMMLNCNFHQNLPNY